MTGPIAADAVDGTVRITCTPRDARDLAEAFATAYATCAELEAERPRWFDDVVTLIRAATAAEEQAGALPEPVMVPVLRASGPGLRLVSGEGVPC